MFMPLPNTNNRDFGMCDSVTELVGAVKVEIVYEAYYTSFIPVKFPFYN